MPVMDPVAGAEPQQTEVPAGAAEALRQEPVDVSQAIDQMTDVAEIGSILFSDAPPPATPAEPEPQGPTSDDPPAPADPAAAQDPAGAQPQDPQAPDATDPQDSPQAQPQSLERISLKSLHPDERVLIAQAKEMVREGKAASFADAFTRLTQAQAGTQEPSPAAQAQAPETPAAQPQTTPPPVPPAIQELESQLEQLQAERDTAIAEYDRQTELKLTKEIERLNRQIAKAEALAEIQQREATVQQQTLQSVIEDVYVTYPESENPKSFFSYRLTQEVQDYESTYGPIANHPQQLKALAAKVAAEVAPPAGNTPAPAQPQAPPQVQPRQTARPIGAAAPGSASGVRVSPDQIQQFINTAEAEDLRVALFGT